jgi:hypothetical protein
MVERSQEDAAHLHKTQDGWWQNPIIGGTTLVVVSDTHAWNRHRFGFERIQLRCLPKSWDCPQGFPCANHCSAGNGKGRKVRGA